MCGVFFSGRPAVGQSLITLSKLIFSCWSLFVAEVAFLFLFLILLWWIVRFFWPMFVVSVVIFCVVFNFLISYSSSFIFCCCLSLLALLVSEKVRGWLFPGFWCLLVGLIDWNLSCMFDLVLPSMLFAKLCLLQRFWLFLKFQRMLVFCIFSFFDSWCFYLRFGFISQVV